MPDSPRTSPILRLAATLPPKDLAKIRDNLSAVVVDGDRLWLGGDEGTAVHRMTLGASGDFDAHVSFDLKGPLGLPGPAKEEIDIEGLDVDGGYLWLIGSHSAKRKKAEDDKPAEENLERLGTVVLDGNRFTLARVPLDASGTPVPQHQGLAAARLKGDTRSNLLTDALKGDTHLGRFVPSVLPDGTIAGVPSKDNGFDVEGLAVDGDRVFFGLRGPVLRGWALVLEVRVRDEHDGTLALAPLDAAGALYRKHFLQLDGLGIRDLVIVGSSLLVLAGPTMDLDGPVYVYRWNDALSVQADSITWNGDIAKVVHIPFGVTNDHAEGLTLVTADPLSVLVCYDAPASSRLVDDGRGVRADIFDVAS